jgi:hypothetical protein
MPARIARELFENTWDKLDSKDQNKLIQKIQSDDTLELSISELYRKKWEESIDTDKISQLITDKVYRRLAANEA